MKVTPVKISQLKIGPSRLKGTKAYIRRKSEATKQSPTKRLRKRRAANKRRRTFPNPAPKGFALYARKGAGPKMVYNGRSFTNHDKPVVFPTTKSADDTGKFLIDAYPLLKQYALTIEPARPPGK